MKVTVAITAHNSVQVIRPTLDAALRQTYAPSEILVLDDGSTDSTVSLLEEYGDALRVIRQENKGLAAARNVLCGHASGDLVAFLDHDDIWHPTYLEVQARHFEDYPDAVAFYTQHVNFYGDGDYDWSQTPPGAASSEILGPAEFLVRFNTRSGEFSSPSFLCVPREVLSRIGPEPFKVDFAEDTYLASWFSLLGSVCHSATPLVAYRITEKSLSADKVKSYGSWVHVFELFSPRYEAQESEELKDAFRAAFASKRRHYAKRLMGAGKHGQAREQLRRSLADCKDVASIGKSVGLLAASFLPERLQPRWPEPYRTWQDPRQLDPA
jgi:glycosyltransferase involved in cell wall biosynthesis